MSNLDHAYGFEPYGPLLRSTLYCVTTAPTIGIYKNDIAISEASAALLTPHGYMPTILDDAQPSSETKLLGSVLACFDEDMNPVNYIAAAEVGNGTIAGYVLVADHPNQLFIAQADSAIGVAALGDNADVSGVAGDATTGISKSEISTAIASVGNLLLVRPYELDDATLTNCRWIVQISEHFFSAALAGTA